MTANAINHYLQINRRLKDERDALEAENAHTERLLIQLDAQFRLFFSTYIMEDISSITRTSMKRRQRVEVLDQMIVSNQEWIEYLEQELAKGHQGVICSNSECCRPE